MEEKLKKVMAELKKMIQKLEEIDVYGPIEYLEEAVLNVDAALDEWNLYLGEQE